MSFSIALVALIWSHFYPHKSPQPEKLALRWHNWLLENFNAGQQRHGALAWGMGVLLPALAFAFACGFLGDLLRWTFEVSVLYFCLGFRETAFHAAGIARALCEKDIPHARNLLEVWRPRIPLGDDAGSITRIAVEETLKAALNSLLGILFWFFLFGVAGALVYRLAFLSRDVWHGQGEFDRFSLRAAYFLDWSPVRVTAFSFAIVGNFQDALESWRSQSSSWGDENQGILLAAGGGALGVGLGGNLIVSGGELLRPSLGTEDPASPESIEGSIALALRAAMLWLAVVAVLWLGSL